MRDSIHTKARPNFRGVAYLLAALALSLAGCGPTQEDRAVDTSMRYYFAAEYTPAATALRPYADKTDENFVLNNCRLGSCALADYDLATAQDAFLKAYEVINSVGVNNGGRSLGAALVDEKIKIWKGEPFERAMANFYLGLGYYMHQDYNNARAAFENALFKLKDYDRDANPNSAHDVDTDFALGYLMLGKCWQRLGDAGKARAAFAKASARRRAWGERADYELNEKSNMLLVVDYGIGPRKVTKFDGSVIGFAPTPRGVAPIPLAAVIVDGNPYPTEAIGHAPVDLLAFAQDRKWQSIDTIRAVKSAVGSGLIVAGAAEGLSRNNDPTATAALIGAGLLLEATSQADVRQWEMLPRTTFVLPLQLPPGKHDITVRIGADVSQTWRELVAPPPNQEATYYMRLLLVNPGPYEWPPPKLIEQNSPPTIAQ